MQENRTREFNSLREQKAFHVTNSNINARDGIIPEARKVIALIVVVDS